LINSRKQEKEKDSGEGDDRKENEEKDEGEMGDEYE
jgi:hypothetical protein